jgi:hypothetical protein
MPELFGHHGAIPVRRLQVGTNSLWMAAETRVHVSLNTGVGSALIVEFPGAREFSREFFRKSVQIRRFRNELTQHFQSFSANSLLLRGREFIASEQGVLSAEQGMPLLRLDSSKDRYKNAVL